MKYHTSMIWSHTPGLAVLMEYSSNMLHRFQIMNGAKRANLIYGHSMEMRRSLLKRLGFKGGKSSEDKDMYLDPEISNLWVKLNGQWRLKKYKDMKFVS